jgi:hypothetical protein
MLNMARTIVTALTALVLAVALVREYRHRGGPYFEVPFTVESHTWVQQNDIRDVLALCKRARRFIPRGKTVTVVRPGQAPNYDATIYLAAVGNLPRQDVVAPRLDGDDDKLPQYVIAVREPFNHPRYVRTADFPEGALYSRR